MRHQKEPAGCNTLGGDIRDDIAWGNETVDTILVKSNLTNAGISSTLVFIKLSTMTPHRSSNGDLRTQPLVPNHHKAESL